ncbi:MAG: polyprenyl synthetase family protein [Melioribacteraceae bacterium]|nr:polyprenyl synthetase family protein [Melioribacteraceae bacterium]MCF8354402.1 polyprenyl synthetase family protein [Melioribacteraceae bacterium]MCF8393001.1 polyprenyl synthetase family protein [Melioribacteraceae bacterium]MCF8417256.1 polyprenyl synthetase family protein [Melioribacteraceae bacterium]
MNKLNLTEIRKPIKDELQKFNELFNKSLKSKVGLVDLVTKYILKQKGKKIRPLLVLLSAKVAGGVNPRSYTGATLVELLHTATLVHDDVVDHAEKRRGFPSINAVWKNKIAVLMGDYLLARGLMIAVENDEFDFLKVITKTVKRMSEGELLQISKTKKLNNNEETYFRIISDKTASLISTCCEIGALSSTKDENQINALKQFGENLGIAFQIRDDILDYVGSTGLIGKPLGADIKEKKLTLPLIYALSKTDSSKASKILKLVKISSKKGEIKEIIDFVKENNGIDYAYETAHKFSLEAKKNLSIFPNSESKLALEALVDFVIDRNN